MCKHHFKDIKGNISLNQYSGVETWNNKTTLNKLLTDLKWWTLISQWVWDVRKLCIIQEAPAGEVWYTICPVRPVTGLIVKLRAYWVKEVSVTGLHDKVLYVPVFSLNFSSAGKGPFMAGKAKNIHQRCNLLGGEGSGEWGTWPLSCWEI